MRSQLVSVPKHIRVRTFTTTPVAQSWLGSIFGKNKNRITDKRREEIIAQQDEIAAKEKSIKIRHLTKENSPEFLKQLEESKVERSSLVKNWKSRNLAPSQLEETYNDKMQLQGIVQKVYKDVLILNLKASAKTDKPKFSDFTLVDEILTQVGGVERFEQYGLENLDLRFELVKKLQSSLGIELNDYTISKCHNLKDLYVEIENVVNTRWKWERNPNAIVLRKEDFTAPNIHLSEERTEQEKMAEYQKVLQQMRAADLAHLEHVKAQETS